MDAPMAEHTVEDVPTESAPLMASSSPRSAEEVTSMEVWDHDPAGESHIPVDNNDHIGESHSMVDNSNTAGGSHSMVDDLESTGESHSLVDNNDPNGENHTVVDNNDPTGESHSLGDNVDSTCESQSMADNTVETEGGERRGFTSSRGMCASGADLLESQIQGPETRPAQAEDGARNAGNHPSANPSPTSPGHRHQTTNNNNDSISKKVHAAQNVPSMQSSKKHVAWQTDRHVEMSARADTDQPPGRVHVAAGVQTDRQSDQPSFSGSQPCGNKGLRDSETNTGFVESETVLSPEGFNGKAFCLAARGNNDLIVPERCNRRVYTPPQSTDTARGAEWDTQSPSTLLAGRRPVSANGVTRREGQCWRGRTLSEQSLRPFSAPGARRLSLPLDIHQRVPTQQNTQTVDGVSDKAVTPTRSSDLNLDAFVKKVEKETRKTVLVTYSERDPIQEADIPSDSLTAVKDQCPRRPQSSRPGGAPRRRPHTAGGAGRPAGSRPGTTRMIRSAPPRSTHSRPWEVKFSREELQRALPRRHFFSCHNKALKDAGFEVEEENARPTRRRLLFFHHEEETPPAPAPPVICGAEAGRGAEREGEGRDREDDAANFPAADSQPETAVQMLSVSERAKRRKSHVPQVECRPLQQYLSYVAENPAEYRHMVTRACSTGPAAALHPSSHPADSCHTARLVSMGRVFQEKHGGAPRTDEVLRAAYSLNPRDADPHRFARPARDVSPLLPAGLGGRKPSSLPNLPRKESSVSALSGGGGEDGGRSGQRSKPGSEMAVSEKVVVLVTDSLTEVEKRRAKAEEWARTVTTEQLVRAKLQVLKELGHEEQELSQWWLAFRSCAYLRTTVIQ